MNVKNEPRAFDHYSNGLITHHTSSSSSHSSSSALSTLWNKTTTITMRSREQPEISSSKIPIVSPIIDLDHRLHRLLAFGLFFLFVLFALVLMSKIYKTVKLLKYRSKHFGYYINPKYETILVNLNRQIRAGSRTLAQNFKKRQFVRVRKYDDDDYDDYDIGIRKISIRFDSIRIGNKIKLCVLKSHRLKLTTKIFSSSSSLLLSLLH